jgi:hypothetical protein
VHVLIFGAAKIKARSQIKNCFNQPQVFPILFFRVFFWVIKNKNAVLLAREK